MTNDVDMKDAEGDKEKKEEEKEEEDSPQKELHEELEIVMNESDIAVTSDALQLALVARKLNQFRGRLNEEALKFICKDYVPEFHLETLLNYHSGAQPNGPALPSKAPAVPAPKPPPEDMEEDQKDGEGGAKKKKRPVLENTVFVYLILTADLITAKRWEWVLHVVSPLLEYMNTLNRRTMDHLAATAYQYLSIAALHLGKLPTIRSYLNSAYRTAALRHNYPCQAVLLNLLIQNYLYEDKYNDTENLIAKTKFPEKADSSQMARYQFYRGRLNLVQLQYSDALAQFQQALRKGPSAPGVALGFRYEVITHLVTCQLLLSEVPKMALFRTPGLAEHLRPYYDLCVVAQNGNLEEFQKAYSRHEKTFMRDKMHLLVLRLRNTVIKTGLRKINLAYSKIPLDVVAKQLGLKDVEETSWVIAKAIRDGVIEASMDFETQTMVSDEMQNLYQTREPTKVLQERTDFLFNVYQDAMKAMRYPEDFQKNVKEEETEDPEEEAKKIEEAEKEDEE